VESIAGAFVGGVEVGIRIVEDAVFFSDGEWVGCTKRVGGGIDGCMVVLSSLDSIKGDIVGAEVMGKIVVFKPIEESVVLSIKETLVSIGETVVSVEETVMLSFGETIIVSVGETVVFSVGETVVIPVGETVV
jgi:hypothetical protein